MKRWIAFFCCFLLFALTAPLIATAQQGKGKKPKPPRGDANSLTIRANPNPVVWGGSTVVSGQLRGANNGGKTVTLERNPYPFTGGFNDVSTRVTPNSGAYSFTVSPGLHTRYRTSAKTSPPVTSNQVLVHVRIRVGILLSDATPARGRLVRFYGSAYPAHDGSLVYIQKRATTGSYRTVARTRLRDAGTTRSRYSRRVRVNRSGVYRVRVAGHVDHWPGYSKPRALRVH